MLAADIEAFSESLKSKDREAIEQIAVDNYVRSHDFEVRIREMEKSTHDMFLEFEAMKNRLSGAEHEISELRKQNIHLTGVYTSQAQGMYGRSSEKTKGVKNEASETSDYCNPLSEDAPCNDENNQDTKFKSKSKGKKEKL